MLLVKIIFVALHLKIPRSFKYFESSDVIVVKKKSYSPRYSYILTRVKKDNMVSCGALGDTNGEDKNYNIIALVTMITRKRYAL